MEGEGIGRVERALEQGRGAEADRSPEERRLQASWEPVCRGTHGRSGRGRHENDGPGDRPAATMLPRPERGLPSAAVTGSLHLATARRSSAVATMSVAAQTGYLSARASA